MRVRVFLTAFALFAAAGRARAAAPEFNDVIFRKGLPELREVRVVQDDLYKVKFKRRDVRRGGVPIFADQVTDIDYGDGPEQYRQGIFSVRRGNYTTAVGTLQGVVERNPGINKLHAPWVLFYLGRANYGARQFGEGLKHFRKLLGSYSGSRFTPQAYLYIGHCLTARGDYEPALQAYEKGYNKIQTLAGRAGDTRLQKWIRRSAIECLIGKGKAYELQARARGEDEKAARRTLFKKAQKVYARASRGATASDLRDRLDVQRADVLYNLGDPDNAVQILEGLIRKSDAGMAINPQTVGSAYYKLGAFYWIRAKKNKEEAEKARASNIAVYKRLIIEAQNSYTRSMFNYLRVTVQFVQGGYETIAGAHFFAGRCYEKLKGLNSTEKDLILKARWHYQIIIDQFHRSGYVSPAQDRLRELGGAVAAEAP